MQKRPVNRIPAFDFIRVISLFGILVCHSCFEHAQNVWAGRYLGATFNFLFLILSAFLLGMSWQAKDYPKYHIEFVWKRVLKLTKSYYPYLVVLFAFLYLTQDFFSWRNLISHFLFLPWFDKIGGFGHLWFLTMIVICYASCWIISKKPKTTNDNALIYSVLMGGVF